MEVLVLGGAGLIGAPIARALVGAGHAVTVVTRGPGGDVGDIGGVERVRADRRDATSLAAALARRRFDLVVDLLVYDGADVARLFDVPGLAFARYAFVSSGQVYLVGAERRPPFAEADASLPLMPEPPAGTREHGEWAYGVGKRAAEAAALELGRARGIATTALRLPVVQGQNDGSRRLWAYLQRLLDGGPLLLPDGGHQPVRFVWAEDVGRAVVALAARTPAALPEPAYNLAQPDEPTLRDLLQRAAAEVGVVPRFVDVDAATLSEAGLDHTLSPYSGRWCSRPDPTLAARDLAFIGTPSGGWLAPVIAAHRAEPAPRPHPGYARRALELAVADGLSRRSS